MQRELHTPRKNPPNIQSPGKSLVQLLLSQSRVQGSIQAINNDHVSKRTPFPCITTCSRPCIACLDVNVLGPSGPAYQGDPSHLCQRLSHSTQQRPHQMFRRDLSKLVNFMNQSGRIPVRSRGRTLEHCPNLIQAPKSLNGSTLVALWLLWEVDAVRRQSLL